MRNSYITVMNPGKFTLVMVLFMSFTTVKAQEDYQIITKDAMNFWNAYDSLKAGVDTTTLFQKIVFDQASEAFTVFTKEWKITAKNYTVQVRSFPKFYASIRKSCVELCSNTNKIKELIEEFRQLYSGFVPADICIGFGNFTTGGTGSVASGNKLVYISLEFHGLDSSTIVTEFNSTMRDYFSHSNFYRTVIHELVHIQQHAHGKETFNAFHQKELASSILREGIPEFIAELVYPFGDRGNHFTYGLAHEEELRSKLAKEIWEKDRSYWIYNSTITNDIPKDLGYFMGYAIAKAYYQNNPGKDVISEIIEIGNLKKFVRRSGYFN